MATKSFLKNIDLKTNKEKRNFSFAIEKSIRFSKSSSEEKEPAEYLTKEKLKKYFG